MNWNRFSISILIILMSLPALFFYMLFILNMLSPDNPISYHWTSYLVLISSVLAWTILFIMALLWSRERVIPKWLATLAVLLAIIGLTPFTVQADPIVFLAMPGFFFGLYLCYRSWTKLNTNEGN